MGFVKFGQQTLNIEGVPDGHIIVPESEYMNYRNAQNAYLSIRSKIPPGIDESSLPSYIDKGIRFDEYADKLKNYEAQVSEYEKKLKSFENIPKDFSIEKWNEYVNREKAEIRSKKIQDLTNRVYEKVKSEFGVSYEVDPRFIPKDILDSFDPDTQDAFDKWYKILDDAHTEQQNFLKKFYNTDISQPPKDNKDLDIKLKHPKDIVSDSGIKVGKLNL